MKTRAELKGEAKEKLRGKWGEVVVFTLVYVVVTVALSFVTDLKIWRGFGEIINFVVGAPLTYGLMKYFYFFVQGEKVKLETLFDGFKVFGRALLTLLAIVWWSFLWISPFFVVAVIALWRLVLSLGWSLVWVFASGGASLESIREVLAGELAVAQPIVLVLSLVAAVGFVWASLNAQARYSQVWYFIVKDEKITVSQAIKKSVALMRGHKVEYLILQFSFVGWLILAVLTLGIGALWLTPYILVTQVFYHQALVAEGGETKTLE